MSAPSPAPWLLLAAGAFGWVWGSFLNMVVDRTPRREGGGPRLGWFSPPRSICLACGTAIPWHDNIPILSYLLLRGRCRHCGVAIGLRTLGVETATPALFVALAALVPPAGHGVWFLWCASILSALVVLVPLLLELRRFGPTLVTLVALIGTGVAAAFFR